MKTDKVIQLRNEYNRLQRMNKSLRSKRINLRDFRDVVNTFQLLTINEFKLSLLQSCIQQHQIETG